MTSDKNPLTSNVIDGKLYYFTSWLPDKLTPKRVFSHFMCVPEGSGRLAGRFPEAYRKQKTHMFISLQFRKVPEAYRKSYRKLVSGVSNILQFRKVPEAGRKNSRKRFCYDSFSR